METRRILLKLLLFAPIVLLVAGVNKFADPANLFRSGDYERSMAQTLAGGQNVARAENFDWRLLRRFMLEHRTDAPDFMVIGSSRTFYLDTTMLGGRTLANDSLGTATLEDYLALYELHRRRGLLPKVLIIGADPWIFRPRYRGNYWRALAEEYNAAMQRLGLPSIWAGWARAVLAVEKFSELVSPSYFQDSLARLWRTRGKVAHLTFYPTTAQSGQDDILRSDGSRASPPRPITVELLRRQVVDHVQRYLLLDGLRISDLEPERQRIFERFLDSVNADGVRAVLLLAPYHPEAYRLLVNDGRYAGLRYMEDYFRKVAAQRGYLLVGSYDPARVPCREEEFEDDLHPRPAVLGRLTQALLDQLPRKAPADTPASPGPGPDRGY